MTPDKPGVLVNCPVCERATLSARGLYEICDYCRWEDDGANDPDSGGGPNGGVSLREARAFVSRFGPLPVSTGDAWQVFDQLDRCGWYTANGMEKP